MKGNEINCYKQSKTFCLPVAPGANYQTEDVPSGWKAGVAGINTNNHQYHLPAWALRNGWCCVSVTSLDTAHHHFSGQCHRSYNEDPGRRRLPKSRVRLGIQRPAATHAPEGRLLSAQPPAYCLPPVHTEPWSLRERDLDCGGPLRCAGSSYHKVSQNIKNSYKPKRKTNDTNIFQQEIQVALKSRVSIARWQHAPSPAPFPSHPEDQFHLNGQFSPWECSQRNSTRRQRAHTQFTPSAPHIKMKRQ